MVLRYQWGEGIGHTYAHTNDYTGRNYVIENPTTDTDSGSRNLSGMDVEMGDDAGQRDGHSDEDSDEHTLEDREVFGWDDEDSAVSGAEAVEEIFDDVGSDPEWADDD